MTDQVHEITDLPETNSTRKNVTKFATAAILSAGAFLLINAASKKFRGADETETPAV